MTSKFQRLWSIPEPHRTGMIWRVIDSRFPALKSKRSNRRARTLADLRLSSLSPRAADGPRYLAATAHRTAGIGHVLSEWNTGLLVARELGLTFLHSSVNSPWEEFLGFLGGYENVEQHWRSPATRIVRLPHVDWKEGDVAAALREAVNSIRDSRPLLFVLFEGQNSYRQHTTGPELRKIYWSHKYRPGARLLREPGAVNVSVHIRRRNTMDMKNPSVQDASGAGYKSRYLDLAYFEQLMELVARALPGERIIYNIFSQGRPEDLKSLERFGEVRYRLDESEFNTFHNLAAADILITSPSSFSFKAGMLCPGLKLCRYPWWHEVPQDEEWFRVPAEPLTADSKIVGFIQSCLPKARAAAAVLIS